MKATLTHNYFSNPDWIFERKLDGQRCVIVKDGGSVCLYSRNQKVLNNTYPELVAALTEQVADYFVLDGEVVAFSGKQTSFSRLQQRMQINNVAAAEASSVAVYLYVFDAMSLDGEDIRAYALSKRKQWMRERVSFTNSTRLHFLPHRNTEGETYFRSACRRGWEGLIAKERHSAYTSARSKSWLKFKCEAGQELVIGGYTKPYGKRVGLGAMLVGYYDDGNLRYAGKVGTGYSEAQLKQLRSLLGKYKRSTSPFVDRVGESEVHFVEPTLVAEIGFTEWTTENKLRHPRFKGLRFDKDPRTIVKES